MTDVPSPRDPMVSRVNELTTTALDTLAVLGVAVGIGVLVSGSIRTGLAVVAAGVALGLMSFASQWSQREHPAAETPPADPPPPGPADPGPLHVMGR